MKEIGLTILAMLIIVGWQYVKRLHDRAKRKSDDDE